MDLKQKTSCERPQRRTRRKAARPAEIVAAGVEEFIEQGFGGARLDRIAKAAGIAKGTIYLYFDSKEALFEAAVNEHVATMMEAAAADVSGFDGPTDALVRRLLERIYRQMTAPQPTALMRVLIAEGERFPQLVDRYHEVVISKGLGVLQAIIARGIERGEVAPGPLTRVPELIIAPAMFFMLNRMIFARVHPLDRDAFIDGHVEMALRGLGLTR